MIREGRRVTTRAGYCSRRECYGCCKVSSLAAARYYGQVHGDDYGAHRLAGWQDGGRD
jgi:hypothetical protein